MRIESIEVLAAQVKPRVGDLTSREREILCLMGHGLVGQEIATVIDSTWHKVRGHQVEIARKLGTKEGKGSKLNVRRLAAVSSVLGLYKEVAL